MYRKTWFYTTKRFISAKHVPKLEISHCRKIRWEKPNLFAIGPVVFAPRTQTYATELKKMTISTYRCHAAEGESTEINHLPKGYRCMIEFAFSGVWCPRKYTSLALRFPIASLAGLNLTKTLQHSLIVSLYQLYTSFLPNVRKIWPRHFLDRTSITYFRFVDFSGWVRSC
jgi:hypothetical protein